MSQPFSADEPAATSDVQHHLGLAVHLLAGHHRVECACVDDHRCDGWRCGKCEGRWPCCTDLAIDSVNNALKQIKLGVK